MTDPEDQEPAAGLSLDALPLEVEPADAFEQSVEVPQDDEDYPEG